MALHARHPLAIGSPRWFPRTGNNSTCVEGPPTPPTRFRLPSSFRLLRGMCFSQCVSETNVGPPTLLFAPASQLIGRPPANPTVANCPLRKFGQGPPHPLAYLPGLSVTRRCRSGPPRGWSADLVVYLQNKDIFPKREGPFCFARQDRVIVRVVCECVAKFGSPPCCATEQQILAGLAAWELNPEASLHTDLELSVVIPKDSTGLARRPSFPGL